MDDPATGWPAPDRTLDRVGTVETRGTKGPATSTASSGNGAAWSLAVTVRSPCDNGWVGPVPMRCQIPGVTSESTS